MWLSELRLRQLLAIGCLLFARKTAEEWRDFWAGEREIANILRKQRDELQQQLNQENADTAQLPIARASAADWKKRGDELENRLLRAVSRACSAFPGRCIGCGVTLPAQPNGYYDHTAHEPDCPVADIYRTGKVKL